MGRCSSGILPKVGSRKHCQMTTNQVPRILFCSLSAKFSLYKEVLRSAQAFCADAIVIGCDSNADCVSAPEVDHFLEIPPLEDLSDLQLLEICRKNKITHILPTRDAELPFGRRKNNGYWKIRLKLGYPRNLTSKTVPTNLLSMKNGRFCGYTNSNIQ